ncbi:MAG: LysR family transcriptional regulator [Porticoccaceae bacterium]|nr:LysR family transcriptional regulator [Porticoccaceae bacterium]
MKASERLYVAQPALSVHLSNLEAELGTQLVTRSHRGIELTEDGALLYERAVVMLKYHQESLNALKSRKDKPKGLVSLGLPSSMSSMLLPKIYESLREELPDVNMYIADASSSVLYEWLLDGKIDLAILFSLQDTNALEQTPLYVEDYSLVSLPEGNGKADEIEFDKIFDYPLVTSSQATTWRKILDEAARNRGKILDVQVETESFYAMRSLVLSGKCCALLPHSSMVEDIVEGRLQARKITNPDLRGLISVSHLKSRELQRSGRAVHDLVVRAARAVAGQVRAEAKIPAAPQFMRATPSTLFPLRPGNKATVA